MFLVYVDESGGRETNNKCSRYFVLAAVVVGESRWRATNLRLNRVKRQHFKKEEVEVKSHWMRIPEKRKKQYCDPLAVTDADVTAVSEGFYEVLTHFKTFAVVVDKHRFPGDGVSAETSITTIAYMALTELVSNYLEDNQGSEHAIFIHDLIQASVGVPKGHQKDIVDLHAFVQWIASYMKGKTKDIIEDVHFASSAQSNFLQLADLVAYNVWNQYERHGVPEQNGEDGQPVRLYPYFERILPRFHKGRTGNVYLDGIRLVLDKPALLSVYAQRDHVRSVLAHSPEPDMDEEEEAK